VFRTDTAGVCAHSVVCTALCAISGLIALLSMPFAEGTYRRFLVASVAKPPLAQGQLLLSGCNNDFVAISVFFAGSAVQCSIEGMLRCLRATLSRIHPPHTAAVPIRQPPVLLFAGLKLATRCTPPAHCVLCLFGSAESTRCLNDVGKALRRPKVTRRGVGRSGGGTGRSLAGVSSGGSGRHRVPE